MLQWLGCGNNRHRHRYPPLPPGGGMRLFQTESSDWSDKALPRTNRMAGGIGLVYLGMTALCVGTYALFGMAPFDALCHGMTTVATGGLPTTMRPLAPLEARPRSCSPPAYSCWPPPCPFSLLPPGRSLSPAQSHPGPAGTHLLSLDHPVLRRLRAASEARGRPQRGQQLALDSLQYGVDSHHHGLRRERLQQLGTDGSHAVLLCPVHRRVLRL